MSRYFFAILIFALSLGAAALLWRRVSKLRHVPRRLTMLLVLAGVVLGAAAVWLEGLLLAWTGLSFEASVAGPAGALMAVMLFAAPLEEGLKVLAVWPLFATRQLTGPRLGVAYAAFAASGFAAAEAALVLVLAPPDALLALRVAAGVPAHLFFAGMWGYALGVETRSRRRWFSLAWLSAMALHGVYDHIVFGRGPGLLVLAAPLLAFMALLSWLALRDVAPSSEPPSSLLSAFPEPPSLGAMRRALRRTDRPLMLHWIGIGALVTLGVVLVSVVLAVYAGHSLGVDFAAADESDVRSSGPLVLVGGAILAAFPVAGYLVARASSATSVLEPAMGSALAIAAAVGLLSVAAPVAVIFALAVAPVAFALACGGAWFGLAR